MGVSWKVGAGIRMAARASQEITNGCPPLPGWEKRSKIKGEEQM